MGRPLFLAVLLATALSAGEARDVLLGPPLLEAEDGAWWREASPEQRLRAEGIDPARWIRLGKPAAKADDGADGAPPWAIRPIPYRPPDSPSAPYAGFKFADYHRERCERFDKALADGRLAALLANLPGMFRETDQFDERLAVRLARPTMDDKVLEMFARYNQKDAARAHAERRFRAWMTERFAQAIGEQRDAVQATYARRIAGRASARSPRERLFVDSVLARLEHPQARALLDRSLARERDPHVYAAVLALRNRETLLAHLDDHRWPVRAAAIRALRNHGDREVIDALIARFAAESGRLRDDLALALNAMTGERLPADGPAWTAWWAQRRETWSPRPVQPVRALPKVKGATGFFGLWTCSRGIVFCLDGSRAMAVFPDGDHSRYELVCRELEQALAMLPDDAVFNVVVYGVGLAVWAKEPERVTEGSLKSLRKFLSEYGPRLGAGAETCAGLMAAFEAAGATADTVILLAVSPPLGSIVDPYQLVTEATYRNELRGFAIHTIGETEGLKEILVNLSARNHGTHAGR